MELDDAVLFAVVAVIAGNQVVMRVETVLATPALFWSANLFNLVLSALVLIYGLPGFEHVPVASWVIGLMLVFHIARNMGARKRYEDRLRGDAREERERIREELRATRPESER